MLLKMDSKKFILEMNNEEAQMLINTLNEMAFGVQIGEDEFETRVGYPLKEVEEAVSVLKKQFHLLKV